MTPLTLGPTATAKLRGPTVTHRLFAAGNHAGLDAHVEAFGALATHDIDGTFIDAVESAGLTGRGGAFFASWRKIAATGSARAGTPFSATPFSAKPVVIANGAEGEPLSFKDKTLLAHAPHLVIDGLLAVARAVAAGQVFIYAGSTSIPAVERALAERPEARRIRVVEAPHTFIAGEAGAVVNRIANGIALPFDHRSRLSDSGLKGRPTLVFNVETLAHLALIARYGPAWFRTEGSDRDPGTRLLSVSGPAGQQVLEVAGDLRLGEVLASAAVDLATVQAVMVGGYHGRWVGPLDYQLSPTGPEGLTVQPGAGVVHVLHTSQCGLEATARIVGYLANESAKQCGPCMFGLPVMARVMNALAHGGCDPRLVGELDRLSHLVTGRGACHHPDGTAQLVGSALGTFADDVKAHVAGNCTKTTRRWHD
ncbi:NADH-ubiquinone oxidoreductase-F iron-sulfur binding region domain-containing protein [Arthrobacter sp.]|uniref:NADH-ubiquinone oxidoreductase-F iron-sulfur binding region domain-containing protein n=1 Tax=Arthrobacter sp. TaxID=1667 RepID=UPI0026E06D7E|nr:NADH-ubiquinone oxidoreductase-F iron-sulfur binding region domain-containing protein [Arthrobacter sp.]MDO5753120.1 NADH-ubiquinone oxidoreductase-F iron-sulfur binding region domain-containing protein [Arthrobacter sp.]